MSIVCVSIALLNNLRVKGDFDRVVIRVVALLELEN